MTFSIFNLLHRPALHAPLNEAEQASAVNELQRLTRSEIYPASITASNHALYFLAWRNNRKALGIITLDGDENGSNSANDFSEFAVQAEPIMLPPGAARLLWGETNAQNAAALRAVLPFLVARVLGGKKSAGCGDRLGLATPGHLRAIRKSSFAPILAQQSMRENSRTGRTPQQVMDEAMWGVFQEGWRAGFGADADHLKTKEDFEMCAAAGYTFFTIDPSAHVDNAANTDDVETLKAKVARLDWAFLETSYKDLHARLCLKPVQLESLTVEITETDLLRAVAKYGGAIRHTVEMARHLKQVMNGRAYELEMSVDETETVTSLAEHIYLAGELQRLNVEVISLAPRYVGEFEKGVDYIGDVKDFETSFAQHFAVSQKFGNYKLSLHSGSDKFSIYPIAAKIAGEAVHLKTAGTSYLEALRAVSRLAPKLFRGIVKFAVERYPTDRATYHVSARVDMLPDIERMPDAGLPELLEDFHAREILHVTFGSVLNNLELRESFMETLRLNEQVYYDVLETHFDKHFAPFGESKATAGD